MLKLVILAFFALTAITEVSTQTETCVLKAQNAQCARSSECCSRCCTAGRCSLDVECFPACDRRILATVEGPDLCRLTKSVDEFIELVKTDVNRDLSNGIPVLASIIKLTNLFFENPLSGFANFTDIIKNVQILRNLLDTSEADTKQILSDVNVIVDTLIRLFNTITSNPQG